MKLHHISMSVGLWENVFNKGILDVISKYSLKGKKDDRVEVFPDKGKASDFLERISSCMDEYSGVIVWFEYENNEKSLHGNTIDTISYEANIKEEDRGLFEVKGFGLNSIEVFKRLF